MASGGTVHSKIIIFSERHVQIRYMLLPIHLSSVCLSRPKLKLLFKFNYTL